MARILFVTNGLPGILYSTLEFALRLRAAGHRVTYASYPPVRASVESLGMDFLPLPSCDYAEFVKVDASRGWIAKLRDLGSRRKQAMDALAPQGFVDDIQATSPELLLVDGELHEYVIALASSGVPLAVLNTFASIWRCPGLPPPHHLARPGVGWKGSRIGAWLLWQRLGVKKKLRAWSKKLRQVGCDRISILRILARQYHFDFRRETDSSQWLIPFTYARLPALSLHAYEFEFPHRPPSHVRYIGPMILPSRIDDRITSRIRAELEAIFRRSLAGGGAHKLIYAGFGSFFSTDIGLLRKLIQVAVDCHDCELVISLGGRISGAELGELPERVHAYAWLPQLEVLKHADIAVTHGGINTIDECVLCAVPVLLYCDFKTDMAGNTSRVLHHGIGLAGDRERDDVEAIKGNIHRLMYDAPFKQNTERLRAAYMAYEDNQVAERAVESLLHADPTTE